MQKLSAELRTLREKGQTPYDSFMKSLLCLLVAALVLPLAFVAETVHEGKSSKSRTAIPSPFSQTSNSSESAYLTSTPPERKQPFGTKAKQALSDLAFGKQARVVDVTKDRYGRIVGRVYVDGIDVIRELVARGHAWVYRKYSNDAELLRIEAKAKARSE